MIHDSDIRRHLLARTLRRFLAAPGRFRVINEMEVSRGQARIDVAVIGQGFRGYEIKSPADTLRRLEGQMPRFNRVFDRLHLVCGEGLLEEAINRLPPWWGVLVVRERTAGAITIATHRAARRNPAPDAAARLELLWSSELLTFARSWGFRASALRGDRRQVAALVADAVPARAIAAYVQASICGRSRALDLHRARLNAAPLTALEDPYDMA